MKMVEITITLPQDVLNFLDNDPYIGDRSAFIAMLIRRFQREQEKSKAQCEASENDPSVLRDPY
jgi:metal-responsive CopG/Arc/MetJ family transcriptional regulator